MRKDVRIGAIIGGIIIGVVIVWTIIASTGRGKAKDPIVIDGGKGIPPTPAAPSPATPNTGAPVGGAPTPAPAAPTAPESGNTAATAGRDTSPEVATGAPAPTPPAAPATPEGTSPLPLAPDPAAVTEPAAGRNSANWAALLGADHVEGDLQPVRTHTPAPAAAPIDPPPVTPEEPVAEPRPGPTGAADPPAASPKTTIPIPPTGGKAHKVAAGETFSSISRLVYGDAKYFKEIVKANPSVDPTHLKLGIVIALPDASEFRKPKTTDKAAAPDKAKTPAALAPINPKTEYRVQSTDSLYKISIKLYHNPGKVDAIYELNKEVIGTDPARLKLNMVLKLPEPPVEAAAGRG
jgi:nucleoid-associated protein YgaU